MDENEAGQEPRAQECSSGEEGVLLRLYLSDKVKYVGGEKHL